MLPYLPSFPLHTVMATTPTKLSLFFFLLFLQLLHARESQFFSKLSPKENELLPTTIQQDQDFIPQTQDSTGYGLYGRLPPSTTTTNGGSDDILPENYNTVAYTTPIHGKDSFVTTAPQYASKNQKQDKFYGQLPPLTTTNGGTGALPENYNTVAYTTPIHSNKDQYHPDSSVYNSRKQGMSETRFMAGGDTGADGRNTYNNEKQMRSDHSRVLDNGKYYHGSDMYNSATNDENMYNTQKQGMSDTRYLENGKYYYDLNSQSSNPRPRVFDSRNGYNNRGYYGNNNNMYNSDAQFQEDQEDVFTP